MAEKKPALFWPLVFGGIGVAMLVRGFYNPTRALTKTAKVSSCSGPIGDSCDYAVQLQTPKGEPVYSVAAGRVMAVGNGEIHILCSQEPTILMYEGVSADVSVEDYVGVGQQIGKTTGTSLAFAVEQYRPSENGPELVFLTPSAWLASRGMSLMKYNAGGGGKWCEGGREITVPSEVNAACKFKKPLKPGWALLPVSVDIEEG